ncbi:MAG: chloride channel protein [Candidatus Methylomirabilales bacterium]
MADRPEAFRGFFRPGMLRFRERVLRALHVLHLSEAQVLLILAVVVGIGAGLGAYLFRLLLWWSQWVFLGTDASLVPLRGAYRVLIAPTLGGMIVGPLIYFFAREAKGHGVPEVMLAVAEQEGKIRPRVALVKILASSLSIGSGGSVGREGPIVQIGSALGSSIGQLLNVPSHLIQTLVACGAAGGISATFNAPIAGTIFALEVILRDFSARAFSLVVLSSVAAAAISRALLGNFPAFQVPKYALESAWELGLYVLLGIVAAVVGKLFVIVLYKSEDIFDSSRLPEYVKPVVGGLCIGGLGFFFPHVMGVGYETIEAALVGKLGVTLVLILLILKILATSITIGSGGSGGIFAPSLFMGAMLGQAYGSLANLLLPAVTAPPGAYALVGMGAVFAGAAQAPITSILILFEMTGDYRIILPLMIASVISSQVAYWINRETIYTLKLIRRGIDLSRPRPTDVLDTVRVADAMSRTVRTIPADSSLHEVDNTFRQFHYSSFPVVDEDERLVGVIGYAELHDALTAGTPLDGMQARHVMRSPAPVVFPQERLSQVLAKFKEHRMGRIPVVEQPESTTLIGIISHSDVLNYYYDFFHMDVSERHGR